MLSKEGFFQEVRIGISKILKDKNKEVRIRSVSKNNEITLCGLTIGTPGEKFLPVLYLDNYYEKYLDGKDTEEIIDEIIKEYQVYTTGFPIGEKEIESYDFIRENLFFRVVNLEKNQEMLKDAPYDVIEDLAITYRWSAYRSQGGMASALIHFRDLNMWGVTIDQLKEDAIKNTKKMFPPSIKKIQTMIPVNIDEDNIPLYVLSNGDHMNGATAMIYEDVLLDFAEKMEEDLYILPSSIHEVILVRACDVDDVKALEDMVKEANQMVVQPDEILSEHVYYFDRETRKINIAMN